jgi:pimeloyl-ACP methyl ester carboxylesterase
MHPLLSAILFHPTYYLFLALATLLLLFAITLLTAIGLIRNSIHKPPYPYRITEETWKATEQAVLSSTVHTSSIKPIPYSYKDSLTQQTFSALALHARSTTQYNPSYPPMVLVHGTGGCALSWCHVIDHLTTQCSDLYILNLPGFAYTDGPQQLLNATDQDIWDFYTHFLEQSFQALNIPQAILIAHSYGAFHSVKFASQYPHRVKHLLLSDCPGIHPTHGNIGTYWALVFTAAFPQCLVRTFGNPLVLAAYTLYDLFLPKPILYYDLQIWARSWADKTVAKFFTHETVYTHWHGFLLKDVLSLPMPVSFIYGEKDYIIPPHHATILSKIADGQVPTYIIKGAGHNPADSQTFAYAFSRTIQHALLYSTPFGTNAKKIATNLNLKTIASFRSTFCWNWTENLVQEYYSYLQSLAPANTQSGPVYEVNQNGTINALYRVNSKATNTTEGSVCNKVTNTSPVVHSHPLPSSHASQ